MPPTGFLLVDKPAGITSHDVVYRARRALNEKSIGHAGTLDPLATGLLILGVGTATRLLEYLVGLDKTYRATITLGATSDTDDADGCITPVISATLPREDALTTYLTGLLGNISQIPPQYSAIKVAGEAAYKNARKGAHTELKPRSVSLHHFEIISYVDTHITIRLHVSSGFYIRSLARDIGTHFGCGGYITTLRREQVGEYAVTSAVTPDALTPACLLPLSFGITHLPRLPISPYGATRLRTGQSLPLPPPEQIPIGSDAAAYAGEHLVAIVRGVAGGVAPHKVVS